MINQPASTNSVQYRPPVSYSTTPNRLDQPSRKTYTMAVKSTPSLQPFGKSPNFIETDKKINQYAINVTGGTSYQNPQHSIDNNVRYTADYRSEKIDDPTIFSRTFYSWEEILIHAEFTPEELQKIDKNGKTPLMLAIEYNNKELIEIIVKNNGITAESKNQSLNILYTIKYAIKVKNEDCVNNWLPKCYESIIDAINYENLIILRFMLKDARLDPNFRDNALRKSFLYYAAENNKNDAARVLIQSGADPELEFLGGRAEQTPLQVAVNMNNLKLAEILLSNGADPNFNKRASNWTPLMQAAFDNKQEMAQLLIKYKAKLNHINNHNFTALLFAIRSKSETIVTALLEAGALSDAPSSTSTISEGALCNYRYLPLSYAIFNKSFSITKLLISHQAKLDDRVIETCRTLRSDGAAVEDSGCMSLIEYCKTQDEFSESQREELVSLAAAVAAKKSANH